MPTRLMTRLKLDLPVEARLRRLADARGRSAQDIMRDAVDQYLEREESRDQALRDAETAWSDYKATGLHVGSEEADTWLARLEDGEDCEPPQPHR